MCLFFANIAAICGKSDREENISAKAPTARRFVISRECPQEWNEESGLAVAPGLVAPSVLRVITARSIPIARL